MKTCVHFNLSVILMPVIIALLALIAIPRMSRTGENDPAFPEAVDEIESMQSSTNSPPAQDFPEAAPNP